MIKVYAIDKESQEVTVLGYADDWSGVSADLKNGNMVWYDLPKPNECYRFGAEEEQRGVKK